MARSGVGGASGVRRRATQGSRGRSWRVLWGCLLLSISIASVLTILLGDGGVSQGWKGLLRLSFGWGMYLAPILFAAFGLALVWPSLQSSYRFRRREAAGWLLLFGCFVTLLQLLAGDPPPSGNLTIGGGYAGWALTQLLRGAMGPGGAFGSAIIAGLVGLVLAAGLGPRELWGGALLGVLMGAWLAKVASRACRVLALQSARAGRALWSRRPQPSEPHFRINRPEVEDAPEQSSAVPIARPRGATDRHDDQAIVPAANGAKARGGASAPLPAAQPNGNQKGWQLPPIALLEPGTEGTLSESDINSKVERIEQTLLEFGIKARVVEVNPGPVVTQFGLDPGFRERHDRSGNITRRDKVKVSEITALRDDLALALAARTVRIEAPVPGRAVIGLEIPNITASVVQVRKVLETATFQKLLFKSKLAVALGQDVSGAAVAADLAKMPHLLIAGATGSGKSVCMNAIVTCFLLHTTPDDVRLVMIDPKRVELTTFRDVPHLLRSVVVDVEHAVTVLNWVTREMENRLKRFEAQGVRNIDGYNRLLGARDGKPAMPHMVVLIDELADLMMTAPEEVERSICRLAQLARATGIHLVIATQRPSVDVVTGLIKANFPTRISFAVASQVDSRTILDATGAEQLLGSGDMLYMPADAAKPRRLQGVFVSDDEVKRVVEFWTKQGPPQYIQEVEEASAWTRNEEREDPAYEKALDVARQHTRISASLLQRRLGLGYNRAARLMDMLEERGVVGAAEGGKPREVIAEPSGSESPTGGSL